MGHDISTATVEKIERNKREGRLCRGANSGRHYCATPATTVVETESFTHAIGDGTGRKAEATMCTRHARRVPGGYAGVNFRVLGHRAL